MEFDYEETVINIEEIISEIESGELTLQEVFEKFSLAVEDLQKCEAFLTQFKSKSSRDLKNSFSNLKTHFVDTRLTIKTT